jgi:Domain of unknown function (DUF4124)
MRANRVLQDQPARDRLETHQQRPKAETGARSVVRSGRRTRGLMAGLAGLALVMSLADAAAAAKIYKWVDEKGVTHYGEAIPPEYKDQAAAEMTKRGVTVRKWDATATPEQRKAAEEKQAREREQKQKAFEQRRRDLALVNTYTSSKEIDDARDRTMQLPLQVIRGLEPRLKRAQDRLNGLRQQLATLNKDNKAVPETLEQDIADQKAEVDGIKADIERNRAQVDAIKAKYESDKRRYMELTQR